MARKTKVSAQLKRIEMKLKLETDEVIKKYCGFWTTWGRFRGFKYRVSSN